MYTESASCSIVAESSQDDSGTPGVRRQQGYTERMKSFLMHEVLSDPDMVAELEAGKGAAHFNMDEYLVSLLCLILNQLE